MNGRAALFDDARGNLCVDWPGPVPSEDNAHAVADIIAKAPHVARVSVTNQRMVVARWKRAAPRASTMPTSDNYTLHACSQGADFVARSGAPPLWACRNDKLRVITEDVGGAFGMKTLGYPETRHCSWRRK